MREFERANEDVIAFHPLILGLLREGVATPDYIVACMWESVFHINSTAKTLVVVCRSFSSTIFKTHQRRYVPINSSLMKKLYVSRG